AQQHQLRPLQHRAELRPVDRQRVPGHQRQRGGRRHPRIGVHAAVHVQPRHGIDHPGVRPGQRRSQVAAMPARSPTGSGLAALVAVAGLAAPRAAASHTITWDKSSLMIDGQRTFLWSGEFHPFRLPSPSLWRDVLQKLKANGYNAVSIYFDWGYHSAQQGVYDFTGVRDMDQALTLAQEAGLYVIAR